MLKTTDIDHIPEELIREILIDSLSSRAVTRFRVDRFKPGCGPVDLLLVRRQWKRIGIPILYGSVEVFGCGRMEKLARSLQDVPSLGLMIRNLHLHGGYSRHLKTVVTLAPNIQVLGLDPEILSKEPNSGLLSVLPRFNPTTLYLYGLGVYRPNLKTKAITKAILKAIPTWKSLKRVVAMWLSQMEWESTPELVTALIAAPSFSEIVFDHITLKHLLNTPEFHDFVRRGRLEAVVGQGHFSSSRKLALHQYVQDNDLIPQDVKEVVRYET